MVGQTMDLENVEDAWFRESIKKEAESFLEDSTLVLSYAIDMWVLTSFSKNGCSSSFKDINDEM